jgi:hypothetical protein
MLYNSVNARLMVRSPQHGQYGLIGQTADHSWIAYKMSITNGYAFGFQFDVCNHADGSNRDHFVDVSYDMGATWAKLANSETYGPTGNHSLSNSAVVLPNRGDIGFTGTAIIRSYVYGAGGNPTYNGWKNIHLHCKNCEAFSLIPGPFQGNVESKYGGNCNDDVITGMIGKYKIKGLNC